MKLKEFSDPLAFLNAQDEIFYWITTHLQDLIVEGSEKFS